MCNGNVTVTRDVEQALQDAIDSMVNVDRMFTAWDITVLARQNTSKVLGNHTNTLKHITHSLLDPFPDDYEKTLVTLISGEKSFLYHPCNKNSQDYHLCEKTEDDVTDVPDEVVEDVSKKTRVKTKISVPKGLLDKIGLKEGSTAYLMPIVSSQEQGCEILTYQHITDMSKATINAEGRLRLRVSCLKNYGLTGPDYDISLGLNSKSILIKNVKDA
ncbi:hypothetical protein LCGC14_0608500 [marine sediment metagenome]|uniref:Uncharacterized protein n=1 Tax=marine sediment metagenome TaxID=412755 RepID=A0A0F9RSJ9_9ZZZZ